MKSAAYFALGIVVGVAFLLTAPDAVVRLILDVVP